MKLIVGLGNPGRKYEGTRHNIGFEVIRELAGRYAASERPKAKFDGELVETNFGPNKILLLCPLTYMNLSGTSVRLATDFYKLPPEDLLVICDDLNLPMGRLRFRPGGSSGGQNGLKDIIHRLGDDGFARLRIGIGKPPPQWDVSRYVLGKFSTDDAAVAQAALQRSADAVECWVAHGIGQAMNQFNADPNKPTAEKKRPNNPNENNVNQDETNQPENQ